MEINNDDWTGERGWISFLLLCRWPRGKPAALVLIKPLSSARWILTLQIQHHKFHIFYQSICRWSAWSLSMTFPERWDMSIFRSSMGLYNWTKGAFVSICWGRSFPVEYQWRLMEYKRWTGLGFVPATDLDPYFDPHLGSITWFRCDR